MGTTYIYRAGGTAVVDLQPRGRSPSFRCSEALRVLGLRWRETVRDRMEARTLARRECEVLCPIAEESVVVEGDGTWVCPYCSGELYVEDAVGEHAAIEAKPLAAWRLARRLRITPFALLEFLRENKPGWRVIHSNQMLSSEQTQEILWRLAEDGALASGPLEHPVAADGLVAALDQCRKVAARGAFAASVCMEACGEAVEAARAALHKSLEDLAGSNVRAPKIIAMVEEQLDEVVGTAEERHRLAEHHIALLSQRLETFTVTLFGRSMVGKSTLMEILTRGDGSSIGKGAQRTTREIRSYTWRGLEVIDVPGVEAYEGEEDEKRAHEAASKADVVVFLISDDAPQPSEAEHLDALRRLGKPVLGVCNVKVAVGDLHRVPRFLERIERSFEPTDLDAIAHEFLSFTSTGAPDPDWTFHPVHLLARFLSADPLYAEHAADLVRASRFHRFEEHLVQQIRERGAFLRVRTFVDGAVVPTMELRERLLAFRDDVLEHRRVLDRKVRELKRWKIRMKKDTDKLIDAEVDHAFDGLRDKVPEFVQRDLGSDDLSTAWAKIVTRARLQKLTTELQQKLRDQTAKRLEEFVREVSAEVKILKGLRSDVELRRSKGPDLGEILAFATSVVGRIGSLVIGMFAPVLLPLALVGRLVFRPLRGLFGVFEASRERARAEIREQIYTWIEEKRKSVRVKTKRWRTRELVGAFERSVEDLRMMSKILGTLERSELRLADALNEECVSLNVMLTEEAMRQRGLEAEFRRVRRVARVPGVSTLISVTQLYRIRDAVEGRLEGLLDNPVLFILDTSRQDLLVSRALGSGKPKQVQVRPLRRTASVSGESYGADLIKMTEQLSCLEILVSREGSPTPTGKGATNG